ncbi:MAG TPA: transposase [Terricaulis sp.]|nr:transposase [Terricaulis sp.]
MQHIVFGLADALPRSVPSSISGADKRAAWADREFDQGYGERLLEKAVNAEIVQNCLLLDDGQFYSLAAWCVMPTHVHALIEQRDGSLSKILQRWKSASAHAINKMENRKGPLWRREYFDRFMRSEQQFEWTIAYIERNPVAAGLAMQVEDWPHSSARWRRTG